MDIDMFFSDLFDGQMLITIMSLRVADSMDLDE